MKDEAELTHHTSIGNKEFTYKLKKVSGMNGRIYPLLIYSPDQLLTCKLKVSGMSGRMCRQSQVHYVCLCVDCTVLCLSMCRQPKGHYLFMCRQPHDIEYTVLCLSMCRQPKAHYICLCADSLMALSILYCVCPCADSPRCTMSVDV